MGQARRPSPHHIGYAVASIPDAVDRLVTAFGAGPFFHAEGIGFDEATYFDPAAPGRSEPATWAHDAAVGRCGDTVIELQRLVSATPEPLALRLDPGPDFVVNHLSFMSDDPEEDGARLEAAGCPPLLHATLGERFDRRTTWLYDGGPRFGHAIEIHCSCEAYDHMFGRLAAETGRWDGARPLRPISELA